MTLVEPLKNNPLGNIIPGRRKCGGSTMTFSERTGVCLDVKSPLAEIPGNSNGVGGQIFVDVFDLRRDNGLRFGIEAPCTRANFVRVFRGEIFANDPDSVNVEPVEREIRSEGFGALVIGRKPLSVVDDLVRTDSKIPEEYISQVLQSIVMIGNKCRLGVVNIKDKARVNVKADAEGVGFQRYKVFSSGDFCRFGPEENPFATIDIVKISDRGMLLDVEIDSELREVLRAYKKNDEGALTTVKKVSEVEIVDREALVIGDPSGKREFYVFTNLSYSEIQEEPVNRVSSRDLQTFNLGS